MRKESLIRFLLKALMYVNVNQKRYHSRTFFQIHFYCETEHVKLIYKYASMNAAPDLIHRQSHHQNRRH